MPVIEIPGYRIVRPLGRGGMASVHLAIQESVQREVALKIMAPTLLGDPAFGERFLREARIAAKLRHPNVVQVHDVGVASGYHYMAMEYLPGGPAIPRDRPPPGLRYALRVTREIASALGYAHARGVIHRDIKPDNILLREDGTAVLTDFGIARANDNVRMTLVGSVVGTPSYMSPEQARGLDLDGRSDLYSLGVVFYELLIGRVPYQAEDSLSVGIMHITAPLPKLPEDLAWLQPVLDRLLAKEPALRFQSGADLAQALADIEQRFTPSPVRPIEDAQLTRAPAARANDPGQGPSLGRVDADLLGDGRSRRREPRERDNAAGPRKRWLFAGLVACVAVLLLSAWWFQQPLREWLQPTNPLEVKLQQAQQALAEDRLGTHDGQPGARELFEAITAIDPDNLNARLGLIKVGERWLALATAAVDRGDVSSAEQALAQARELAVPANQIARVELDLRALSSHESNLGDLLARAETARSAGRLDGDGDSALALYAEVNRLDAGNPIAANGISTVLSVLIGQASQAIDSADYAVAEARIARIAEVEPAHPDLPAMRTRLAEARQAQVASEEAALQAADRLLQQGRLTTPKSANALAAYQAVLDREPGNERARAGLAKVGEALLAQFDRALADFDFERADALLDGAERAGLAEARLAAARKRMQAAQERQQALDRTVSSAGDPARLRLLLDEAASAAEAGNLFAPPGDSAYDKFKQVLSADPRHAEAKAGLAALPERARQRFEQSMQGNRLADARGYVEGLESFRSDDPALPAMRRRLAQAYAGFAAERLQAGELQRAQQALEHAQVLDPHNPELVGLRARLEQAGAR